MKQERRGERAAVFKTIKGFHKLDIYEEWCCFRGRSRIEEGRGEEGRRRKKGERGKVELKRICIRARKDFRASWGWEISEVVLRPRPVMDWKKKKRRKKGGGRREVTQNRFADGSEEVSAQVGDLGRSGVAS
jgi:hypothetical protein